MLLMLPKTPSEGLKNEVGNIRPNNIVVFAGGFKGGTGVVFTTNKKYFGQLEAGDLCEEVNV